VVFLKKKVNQIADSTTDFYCFYIKCWPGSDSTDIADTIPPGGIDETFATHVCHVRRVDAPPLVPGFSSVTYTLYDRTTYPQPVEESVTVNYLLSGLGIDESRNPEVGVYPNPSSTAISIRLPEDFAPGEYRVQIYNSLGKRTLDMLQSAGNRQITLPVHHLPDGIYFGQLSRGQGASATFRFVVNH
jgi:hypothetical protein